MYSIKYLQKMKQSFIKKGKKAVMEKLFHNFLIKRVESKKKGLKKILLNARRNSTPYVKLRTRKRGRRTLYRVTFLEKEAGLRKALLAFSKNLNEHKDPKFLITLEKDLEFLSSGKSSITAKRNEFHKTALRYTPYA